MRIVHVTNYFMPELGYQEHYLAKHQAQAGHDVHVITSDRAYPPQPDYAAFKSVYQSRTVGAGVERRDGYTLHRLAAHMENNMQLVLRGLTREIRSLDPDLVVAHGFTRFETLRLAVTKALLRPRFRLLVDDHTLWSAYHPVLYRRVYHRLFRAAYRVLRGRIDLIVPVAQETAEFLGAVFRVPASAMEVVPLGADCDLFTFSPAARTRTREQLGIPADAILVVYAGKITKEKGVHLLHSAFGRIALRRSDCFLLIIGSGVDSPYAAEIRAGTPSDVQRRVIWHEHVSHEELPAYFSAADLAVWPLQETMAALEAAACGRPIVLRDTVIGRERTAAGNGLTCGSAAELEAALATLVDDPALREAMGRRGATFIRGHFDWAVIAKSFSDLGDIAQTSRQGLVEEALERQ